MESPRAPNHRKRRLRVAVLAAFLVASGGLPAARAEPSGSDKAAAQVLFDDALKLLGKKQFKEACGKLEESQRLDPQMGTKYRLADCYEQDGRTASAWVTYREVAEDAKAKNLVDREKKARERAAKLETKLSRLSIVVDAANGASLHVTRDGSDVGAGQLGTAVPVDPGSHRIEASAPGKKTWTTTTEVGSGATASVTVPALEAVPVVAEKVTPPPRPVESSSGSQKTVGLVVGSVGLVAIGVSTALIFTAKGLVSDASPHCNGNACDPTGLELRDRARSRGNVATVIFGLGAAAVVGGGVLWLTGADSTAGTVGSTGSRSTSLGVGPGWLVLRGWF